MPTITIDGRAITTGADATILDAARSVGIDIPTLCWYPKLPIVGNCRICLVSVEGQPKLLPACATKVADGMKVTTESHAAVENRRGVLRLLLERYPGEHLADGGRAHPRNEFERYVTRYDVTPTPLTSRDLPLRSGDERPGDPMIRHDMTTCILCTRCVRACEDIQVVGVLDVAYRGEHAEIIVGADGDPDKAGCTWCGECVRVCPTGAIFEVMPRQRFSADQIRKPERVVRGVCPYCGVGCQVDFHVADGRIARVTSPDIEADTPNYGSTCVKGRFGYDFPQHKDRLLKPLIRRGWKKEGERWVWRGAQGAERRGRVGARSLGGALPGEAGDVADDRVGADGRAADGVDRAAVAAGEEVDEVEDQARDEMDPLGVEGDALAVEEHVRSLAGGEDEVAAEDALFGDEPPQPVPRVHGTPLKCCTSTEQAACRSKAAGSAFAIILALKRPCHPWIGRPAAARRI